MSKLDLSGANLQGVSLLLTKLSGANLAGACLEEALMRGADLADAQLDRVFEETFNGKSGVDERVLG